MRRVSRRWCAPTISASPPRYDYNEAILGSDVTFIIVPHAFRPDGKFSTKYVIAAAEKIGAAPAQEERLAPGIALQHRDARLHRRRTSARA